jgi:hypothetical protein
MPIVFTRPDNDDPIFGPAFVVTTPIKGTKSSPKEPTEPETPDKPEQDRN